MDLEECTVIFIGKKLKNLSKYRSYPFHTQYLESSEQFFKSYSSEQERLQHSVVFHHFPTADSLIYFMEQAELNFQNIFLFTPLVACYEGNYPMKLEPALKRFDYVVFYPPEKENIKKIIEYVDIRKKDYLEKKSLQFIKQAILLDLFERQGNSRNSISVDPVSSPQLYYSIDKYGIIKSIGDEVLSILGFSKDEIIGHHFSELIAKDEFEKVKNAFTERRTGERRLRDLTVKLKTKDGRFEEFVFESQGVHIPTIQEHPEKDKRRIYIGTFGKAEPKQRYDKSIAVFHSSLEPIIIFDLIEKNLIVNRGFEEFSGYKQKELSNKDPSFFERPDSSLFSQYADAVQKKGHLMYNTVFVTKSGKEQYCEVSLDFVKFEQESLIIAIYSDLTHFVKLIDEAETLIQLSWDIGNATSQKELIEAAATKEISILKVPVLVLAVLTKNAETVEQYFVTTTNYKRWISWDKASFHRYLKPLVQEAVREKKTVYRTVDKTLGVMDEEVLRDFGQGGVTVISPLIVNNQVIGCIIVFQEKDNTFTLHGIRLLELSTNVIAAGIYKLRLESELRKNLETLETRVQERTKELEDFIYTVSHDLKSPLHAARGFADMVKSQFGAFVKGDEDEYILRRIHENIDQAISMINDLLMLSRIGTKELKFEKVDLNAIINDYAFQFSALNKENIRLDIQINNKIPEISADMGRMVQLFTNIFDNSIKYRKNKNVRIVIESEEKNGMVKLLIGDNGIGVDERDLEHVFKIFYRGRCASTEDSEGSGLGLTIVKKIIQQHGGTIDIKSTVNAGTTLIIDLPMKHES